MWGHVVLVLLFSFAACAGTTVPPAGGTPTQRPTEQSPMTTALLWSLADCKTADEIRVQLAAGLEEKELHRVGFDQVTIAECIAGVTSAVLDGRARPDDQLVLERLSDSVELYVAARREAAVRRVAGAASCLPPIR